jgi:hypothetical protein
MAAYFSEREVFSVEKSARKECGFQEGRTLFTGGVILYLGKIPKP